MNDFAVALRCCSVGSDSGNIEELDEIMVCPEAWHSPDLQDARFGTLGGNDSSQCL